MNILPACIPHSQHVFLRFSCVRSFQAHGAWSIDPQSQRNRSAPKATLEAWEPNDCTKPRLCQTHQTNDRSLMLFKECDNPSATADPALPAQLHPVFFRFANLPAIWTPKHAGLPSRFGTGKGSAVLATVLSDPQPFVARSRSKAASV